MFCSRCGSENLSDAMFCERCGSPLGAKQERVVVEDNQILLKIKPIYKFVYNSLPTILILLVFLGFLPITLGIFLAGVVGGILIGVAVWALIIWAIIWFTKKQFDSTTYNFYRTKLVYRDSFLNLAEKEIKYKYKYKYIRETVVSQGVFERMFNLGTINLYTNAESGMGNGIMLKNVENVQGYYQAIKKIINS